MTDPRARAGRQAAILFAVGAARILLGLVPSHVASDASLLRLALADAGMSLLAFLVPWQRLPRWASALLALPAFAVVGGMLHLGLVPLEATSVPYLVVFAWVGAHHRRGTSLALLPAAALSLALPMAASTGGLAVRPLVLVMGGCVAVAEVIAYAMAVAATSRARAEHAARAFGVVARASAGLHALDPHRVLDAVADAVVDLGYDGANLAVIDVGAESFRPEHTRGICDAIAGHTFGLGAGVTGQAWLTGEPVVVEDYEASPLAIPGIRGIGARSVVAVPVQCRRDVVAVLHAVSRTRRDVPEEEVEAMRILAATAGAALESAEQFLAERTSAQRHAAAALTDPLTGVGNRRFAHQLLEALRPGDSVVMLDLDGFKDVNDRLGHPAGDLVLRTLAEHLVAGVREHDRVARFGGEEFLVVLRGLAQPLAERTVQRLLDSWHATAPVTTFSAGLAVHRGGPAEATLEQADRALYAAKAAGRDTWRCNEPDVDVPTQRRPVTAVPPD